MSEDLGAAQGRMPAHDSGAAPADEGKKWARLPERISAQQWVEIVATPELEETSIVHGDGVTYPGGTPVG